MNKVSPYEAYAQRKLGVNLPLNVGPSALGYLFDLTLFGVICHQMIVYHGVRASDRLLIRVLLYWAFLMGLFQTCYEFWHIWDLFVVDYGELLGFMTFHKYGYYPSIVVATALPAQLFYLDRAYRLWHQPLWVPMILAPLILGSVSAAIGASVRFSMQGYNPDLTIVMKWFYAWDACTLAADIGLTVVILVGLARAKTGWAHTDHTLSRLIRITAEAQLIPAAMTLGILITTFIDKESHVAFFWFQTTGKAYIVSMLAVLNFRISMGQESTSGSKSDKVSGAKGSQPEAGDTLVGDEHEMITLHQNSENV